MDLPAPTSATRIVRTNAIAKTQNRVWTSAPAQRRGTLRLSSRHQKRATLSSEPALSAWANSVVLCRVLKLKPCFGDCLSTNGLMSTGQRGKSARLDPLAPPRSYEWFNHMRTPTSRQIGGPPRYVRKEELKSRHCKMDKMDKPVTGVRTWHFCSA